MSSMLDPDMKQDQWVFKDCPGKKTAKKVLSVDIYIVIKTIFETHVYSSGGHNYIQWMEAPLG